MLGPRHKDAQMKETETTKATRGKLRSRRADGEPKCGRHKGVQQELKTVTIPRPSERMPVLQEGKKFEERVRSTTREHPLNHHLVASSPKIPHHSREDKSEQSALTANLGGPYLQKLCKLWASNSGPRASRTKHQSAL